MGLLKRLFGKRERIPNETIEHASKGFYVANGSRLAKGGHGQEAIDYMDRKGIKYNVVKTYKNGVRVGNVPNHKDNLKKEGINQSWFPKSWDREKIKKAGQSVAAGKIFPDGEHKYGFYRGVNVGIIRTNGKIGTIFPNSPQLNKKGREKK